MMSGNVKGSKDASVNAHLKKQEARVQGQGHVCLLLSNSPVQGY